MPSPCNRYFLMALWSPRASIQKRARPKLYYLALEVIQYYIAVACPDLREGNVDPPISSWEEYLSHVRNACGVKNFVAGTWKRQSAKN